MNRCNKNVNAFLLFNAEILAKLPKENSFCDLVDYIEYKTTSPNNKFNYKNTIMYQM